MSNLGTAERPLRVAIVGSGPSGFYAADFLLKQQITVKVDMFEKFPVPFGLVRYGVAPDHAKIKNVTKVFEKTAEHPNFAFFGNVTVGKNISVIELNKFYDAVIFSYGAESDRHLEIPGENLVGSYTATDFVAWYNGHPDFQDHLFDFSHDVAVIVGQGNVAMDVARILCKTTDELKKTDITQHALEVLAESKIKEVHVFGRRGPAQASFTPPEIKEMTELEDCYPIINPSDLELNEASLKEIEDPANASHKKNIEILRTIPLIQANNRKRKFYLHFKRGPVALLGQGQVEKVRFEINDLVGEAGKQKTQGTGKFEEINCGMFFRSVGYVGVPLKGLPFSTKGGFVTNKLGRVIDGDQTLTGWYVSGWIKRGATGVIGTNKPDSEETAHSLLEDLDRLKPCAVPNSQEVVELLKKRNVKTVTFADWKKIDAAEVAQGEKLGKIREKFAHVSQMLSVT